MIHYITTEGISNTWVGIELEVMERKRVPFVLHSLRTPPQHYFAAGWAKQMHRNTRAIYPLPLGGFLLSVLAAPFLFGRRFWSALANALFGKRESLRARAAAFAHLFVACHWARGLRGRRVGLIHAQWIHSSGTVGMYGAWLLGVPFSFTGHAVDLFRDRVALADKIRRAEFIVCISNFHREFYKHHGARDEQLHLVYCGIDTSAFAARPTPHAGRPRILSVGRLVEKKGFGPLIEACRLLADRGQDFECVIAGDGPLGTQLLGQVEHLDLGGRVTVTNKPLLQEELPAFLAEGAVFAQPCVWSADNDVDGTPRTLMEAMACGLPAVATRIAGLPDIVEHERSGLLVEPNDVPALADALQRLLTDRRLAERLAQGGRAHILERFALSRCLDPLERLFAPYLEPRDLPPSYPDVHLTGQTETVA
jgi:glycosyltransferase involved in cell wall biosynthesis